MSEAILKALLMSNQDMSKVVVIDIGTERLAFLRETYGVQTSLDSSSIGGSEVVILAVKPQNVTQVAEGLLPSALGDALLLSIVAGCTITTLKSQFKTNRLVRSMPNTPASILEGITVWTATLESPVALVDKARYVLSKMGEQIEVSDESYLDMATAISGSGPAYIFLIMEALVDVRYVV